MQRRLHALPLSLRSHSENCADSNHRVGERHSYHLPESREGEAVGSSVGTEASRGWLSCNTENVNARMLNEGSHKGWLAEVDEQIVGFTMGDRTNGEMWVIAVLKALEGREIGRALMNRVEEWLSDCGWDEIWLTPDVDETLHAVGFYRHLRWEDWKFEAGDRFMRKQMTGTQTF
ncbi:MAG: hypothetical protein CMO80_14745 [Verrucomicrobiales bacterium]|nr:hypothetical protein [Verrucomicrobiales bacterium]